jgi:hypothetical protein
VIDTEFIIRYTNGLYTTPEDCAPRYDEFRDMFSSGQLKSKEWAVNELKNCDILRDHSVIVAGSWYGTLGLMIKNAFPEAKVRLLDIDARCKVFIDNITHDMPDIQCMVGDMFDYTYTEDLVVNTSCEHIRDVREWLNKLPLGTFVLLQSNNYSSLEEHVGCVSSIDEFKEQTSLGHIMYSGELEMPMYTRYMLIGTT